MNNPSESSSRSDPQPPSEPYPQIHLPQPTVWPAVMAAGITLILAGILLSLAFSVAGLIVFAMALAGWIGDLLHD